MNNVGIVGSEGVKFTSETRKLAKQAIKEILLKEKAKVMISGHCHLGGIDIWAEEIADDLKIQLKIFPPRIKSWEGGYKQRNLLIANNSDVVYCITLLELPKSFKGMRFTGCYHCLKRGETRTHVKSGGCWTMWKAKDLGRKGKLVIIGEDNEKGRRQSDR